MTPSDIYRYAILKGLADVDILIQKNDEVYCVLDRENVGLIEFNTGHRLVIRQVK